jgi:ABC-2 type transport system ATP-binding protein
VLAIDVRGLRKSYGGRLVLDGVDLQVPVGQTVALLGPNGAGKTTTVEILEGFREPDAGSVRVLGGDPRHASADARARVGVVLQETRHDPYLTVQETVELSAGWYPDPMQVHEVLALVSLSAAAGQRVARLSGGQQRRLDVALGVVGQPELLFLDEPTTGFDPVARREAWQVLRRLRDLGVTVVLTTHYLDEAAVLADRVLVLTGGRIAADSPPGSLGGRDRKHLVGFRLSHGRSACPVPSGGDVHDGRWSTVTSDVTATMHALSDWARDQHCELDDLQVTRASLEDAYLALIA